MSEIKDNIRAGSRINIKVYVTQISGEKFWDNATAIPSQLQISVNVNVMNLERKTDTIIEAPFVFAVNFTPSIAQISIKGKSETLGEKKEIDKILTDHKEKKTPPTPIIQAISNVAMAEAILISKILGIPPPLPSIAPSMGKVQQPSNEKYTA